MFGVATIDVLIGLTVVFLLFSLTCSACIELLAAWFCWRAANLVAAVSSLLQDNTTSLDAFFAHPRIWTLSPDPRSRYGLASGITWLRQRLLRRSTSFADGNGRPSYLSADTFSGVLLDLIVPTDAPSAHRSSFWLLRNVVLGGDATVGSPACTRLPLTGNAGLREVLRSFVETAQQAAADDLTNADAIRLAALKTAINQWFNDTMERATGWYKRKVQQWIFAISLLVAVAFNVDTLSITQALYTNPGLRQQAAALGEQIVRNAASQPATTQATTNPQESFKKDVATIRELGSQGLPLGWSTALYADQDPTGQRVAACLLKALGLVMTALAVSLGAPFWFGVLNKLVSVRAAGARPSSDDKGSALSAEVAASLAVPAFPIPSGTTTGAPALPLGSAAGAVVALPAGLPADYWSREERRADFATFVARATDYCPANAACLARAALLAYQNEDTARRIVCDRWGFHDFAFMDEEDTQAFVAASDTTILIAFRGTEPTHLQDILADARIALVPTALSLATPDGAVRSLAFASGRAHSGFLRALALVTQQIDDRVRQFAATLDGAGPKGLWITGHSLGAALATLYAARLLYATQQGDRVPGISHVQGLYTFGSPRVGDPALTTALAAPLASVTYRFVNHEDIVTRVAPRAFGYDHLGQVMYLDQNGVLDRTSVGWVRFLNTVIDAMDDFKMAAGIAVKDHSMELYLRKLENLAAH